MLIKLTKSMYNFKRASDSDLKKIFNSTRENIFFEFNCQKRDRKTIEKTNISLTRIYE